MSDQRAGAALLRLLTWLSPAFPVGAFVWSGGLERAVHDRWVSDADGLKGWITTALFHGAGWNDAVFFAEAWRKADDLAALGDLAELAAALAGSRERHQETLALGEAFLTAAAAWAEPFAARTGGRIAYPVAVGAVAGQTGVPLADALAGYLHAAASQMVSAGLRLGVCGQKQGVALLASLEGPILDLAAKAAASTLDDLGSAAIRAEIAVMRHETQYSRLFKS